MNFLIKSIKYLLIFILLIMIYNFSLYLVSLFPSSMIYENCVKSANQMKKEDYAYVIAFPYNVDNATDALIINEAYSIDNTNPVESYLKVRKNYNKDMVEYQQKDTTHDLLTYSKNKVDADGNPVADDGYYIFAELFETLSGNLITSVNYARYYHGYLVIYRPLLLLFDAFGIRVLSFIMFLILFVVLAYELYKKLGKFAMFAICFSLIAFDYLATSYSLQQAPIMALTIITSIIVLLKIEKYDWDSLTLLLFIAGSLACFFDFLTTPTLTLALPLLIYVLYQSREKHYSNKELFLKVFKACVVWAIGYLLTWISKWIICDLFTDAEVIKLAIEQVKYRSVGAPRTEIEYILLFVKHLSFTSVLSIVLVFILDILLKKKVIIISKGKTFCDNKPIVLFVCLVPIFWCFVTFNHFINHSMLSYKNFMFIFVLVFLLFFEGMAEREHK